MNRSQHVTWVKQRAMDYANAGDVAGCLSSLQSDLRKHPDTHDHAAIELSMMLAFAGHLSTTSELVEFVEGIN